MSARQLLGADVIRHCQQHSLGLVAYEPSLQTERMPLPGRWDGSAFIAPDSTGAGQPYRQSHERWLDP